MVNPHAKLSNPQVKKNQKNTQNSTAASKSKPKSKPRPQYPLKDSQAQKNPKRSSPGPSPVQNSSQTAHTTTQINNKSPSPTPPTRKRLRHAVQDEEEDIEPAQRSADHDSTHSKAAEKQPNNCNAPVIVGINRKELYEIKRKTQYLR